MDGAKKKLMQEVEWKIVKTCRSCRHGGFLPHGPSPAFGECLLKKYYHGKHKRMHPMPAHISAVCKAWEESEMFESVEVWLKSEVTS